MKKYLKSLPERFDAAIAGSTGVLIVWLAVAVVLSTAMFLAVAVLCDFSIFGSVAGESILGKMQGVVYHLLDLNDLYKQQSGVGVKIFTVVVTFVGMVLLNGMLITTISNIVSRRVADINEGRVSYRAISDHYVIIGYSRTAICVIDDIFRRYDRHYREQEGRRAVRRLPKILLMTGSDVQRVRSEIYSHTPKHVEKRIFIYSGNIESAEHLERLNIHSAREIFVLGDIDQYGRDSKNLAALKRLALLRGPMAKRKDGRAVRVNVQFDRTPSYSNIQRLDVPHEYLAFPGEARQNLYFRPFNFYENWSRLLWSYYAMEGYAPLDFEPLRSDRHVHLVIVGFNRMGLALLLEALRICHYPNYDGTSATKTRLTVIDRDMDTLLPSFRARYPWVEHQIEDIELEFVAADVEQGAVRKKIAEAAADYHALLTIAVALHDPDESLAVALNLPEEVYRSESKVLVRQELLHGLGEVLDCDEARHRNVRVFGMLTEGVSDELLDDTIPMFINHNYERLCRGEGLQCVDTECVLSNEAYESWVMLSENRRYANRYQVDAFGGYKRTLEQCGVSRAEDVGSMSAEVLASLARAEHRRWIAERSVSGWRAVREGETRDNVYHLHDMIVPYERLTEQEQRKDEQVIRNVLALDVLFRMRAFETCRNKKKKS